MRARSLPDKRQQTKSWIGTGQLLQQLAASVAAAIVHEENLIVELDPFQDTEQILAQGFEVVPFVENGEYDREVDWQLTRPGC